MNHPNSVKWLCLLCLVIVAGVTACGKQNETVDSPSNEVELASPSEKHLKGVLAPLKVINLQYETGSHKGFTSSAGEYYYLPGETIEFAIGAIRISAVPASNSISLVDLLSAADDAEAKKLVDISRAQSINFFGLLLTLDQDGDPGNGINISLRAHQTAPYISLQTPLSNFSGSKIVRDWIALLNDIGEARAPVIISEYETLAFLTDLMESNGHTHYTNGYRLALESTYRNERVETDDPIDPENLADLVNINLSAPLVMDLQASYRADDSLASLITSTHYAGSPLISMLVDIRYDSSAKQLVGEHVKAWRNWWKGDSGDLYQDVQFQYYYTAKQAAYRTAIKIDPLTQTSTSEKEVFRLDAALRHTSTIVKDKNDNNLNEIRLTYSAQKPHQLEVVSQDEGVGYRFSYNDDGQLAAFTQTPPEPVDSAVEHTVYYNEPGEVRILKAFEQGEPELTVKKYEKGKCTASDLRLMIITLPHQRRCLPSASWL